MLTAYQQQTQRLLNDEANQFFNLADLTVYINNARNDIARQTECLIAIADLSTTSGTQSYAVSALTAPTGLLAPINVRSLRSIVSSVSSVLEGRAWQWFVNYYLNGSNSTSTGTPTVWAQQSQGATGTFYLWPTPNATITVAVEASWYPIQLTSDSTTEAIPSPWTDAVPYFAAYQGFLQAQRMQDAGQMLSLYNQFIKSARLGVTPLIMPPNFPGPKGLQGSTDSILTLGGGTIKPASQGEGSVG